MVRKIWTMPLMLVVAGMVAVGCGETEDYSALENDFTTAEEAALAAHADAMNGWNEWNSDLTTITVSDDWDTDHVAAHSAANAKLAEYKARLDEGQANVDRWKADLEAAKTEGGEAYSTALTSATTWYNDYTTWLNEYKADWAAYQEAKANSTEGSEPWWYVMYGTNVSIEDPTAATGDNADADMGGVKSEEAGGDVDAAADTNDASGSSN